MNKVKQHKSFYRIDFDPFEDKIYNGNYTPCKTKTIKKWNLHKSAYDTSLVIVNMSYVNYIRMAFRHASKKIFMKYKWV